VWIARDLMQPVAIAVPTSLFPSRLIRIGRFTAAAAKNKATA
jgi:hypothetical protein